MSAARRLRVSHVVVQPVLVWDDGEELSPGPTAQAMSLPLSALASLGPEILREVSAAQTDSVDGPPK